MIEGIKLLARNVETLKLVTELNTSFQAALAEENYEQAEVYHNQILEMLLNALTETQKHV